MNYENMSTIGVDKVWMRVATGALDISSINLDDDKWTGTPKALKVDGIYTPVKDSFHFDGVGEGHLMGTIDLLSKSADIQFNPTHFYGDYALTSNIGGAFDKAFNFMSSIGLKIDKDGCSIKRLDTALDATLSESPSNYAVPLEMYLSAKRESTRLAYTDGLTIGNQAMQVGFYNRSLHLTKKKVTHALHVNTARNEIRCLSKGAKVWMPKYYGKSIHDVINMDADAMRDAYREQFKTLVSIADESAKLGTPHPYEMASNMTDEMLYFKSMYGDRWNTRFLNSYGLQACYDRVGESQFLEMIMYVDELKTAKLTRYRLKKKFADALAMERIRTTFTHRKAISYVDEYLQTYAS